MMVVETDRLILRELEPGDYEDMVRVFRSFQDPKWFPDFPGHVRGWLQNYLGHQERYGYGMYAVIQKDENRLIGDCGLEFYEEIGGGPEVEIAYEFDRDYWGKGYATEAAMAVSPTSAGRKRRVFSRSWL